MDLFFIIKFLKILTFLIFNFSQFSIPDLFVYYFFSEISAIANHSNQKYRKLNEKCLTEKKIFFGILGQFVNICPIRNRWDGSFEIWFSLVFGDNKSIETKNFFFNFWNSGKIIFKCFYQIKWGQFTDLFLMYQRVSLWTSRLEVSNVMRLQLNHWSDCLHWHWLLSKEYRSETEPVKNFYSFEKSTSLN